MTPPSPAEIRAAVDLSPLLHMLGIADRYCPPWRNHYVTGADADPAVLALVEAGLVEETRAPGFLASGDHNFRATDAGRAVAIAESRRLHPPPSKSRARYLMWLDLHEVSDISFKDFLARRLYDDDVRREVFGG